MLSCNKCLYSYYCSYCLKLTTRVNTQQLAANRLAVLVSIQPVALIALLLVAVAACIGGCSYRYGGCLVAYVNTLTVVD